MKRPRRAPPTQPPAERAGDNAVAETAFAIADSASDGSIGDFFAESSHSAGTDPAPQAPDGSVSETDAPVDGEPASLSTGDGSGAPAGENVPPPSEEALPVAAAPSALTDPAAPRQETPSETSGGGAEDSETEMRMSLREHLIELRGRLLRCVAAVLAGFIGTFYFAPYIRELLVAPLQKALPPGGEITFINLTEPFLVDMRIALVVGLFAVSPYVFYQIWSFIAPGLYASERKYVVPVALCSAAFFIAGGAFCYFVVFPFAFEFFSMYGQGTAKANITLENHYSFSLRLLLAFGCIFEMPLFSFFLARLGAVTAQRMRAWRKYAILANFIIAAIITPPDVLSQLLMAAPLLLLYEISIWVAAVFGRKEEEEEEGDGKPDAGTGEPEKSAPDM